MEDECGFDCLGWEPYPNGDDWENEAAALSQLGAFDYMSLLKGGAGMLQGAGGLLSGGGAAAPADAERMRLAAEKQAAESSARTWKIIGGITLGVVGLGGIALLARR